jgi:hypothetical protein
VDQLLRVDFIKLRWSDDRYETGLQYEWHEPKEGESGSLFSASVQYSIVVYFDRDNGNAIGVVVHFVQ